MRYIGIDLHTNSFTVCILEEGKAERISTYCVQGADCERLILELYPAYRNPMTSSVLGRSLNTARK